MNIWISAASALFALGLGASIAAQPAPSDALPPGPGHDALVRVCSGCHSPEIVADQRLTADGWHDVVEQMAGNGAQGTDAEFDEITAYLTKNFPADSGS